MLINTEFYDHLLLSGKKDIAMKRSISDFVATLFYDILKRMWRSIPRSGLIPETNAERWYTDMFLFEVSKEMSRNNLRSLNEMIYRHLARKVFENVESTYSAKRIERENMRSDRRVESDEHDNGDAR